MRTPGPWIYSVEGGSNYIRSEDGKLSLCDMQYYPWIEATEDDWRLIAAAPELLEALKAAYPIARGRHSELTYGPKALCDQIERIIAKVEGLTVSPSPAPSNTPGSPSRP